jgi:excisionase family DNA binding protein
MKQIEPKFMGVDDAEARSGISRWTWRRMAYAGRIASSKVGKRLLIPTSEVDRVLSEGYRPAIQGANR